MWVARMAPSSEWNSYRLLMHRIADRPCVPFSVMSFVGYDYAKQKQLGGELSLEELGWEEGGNYVGSV